LRWSISQPSPSIGLRFRKKYVRLGQILEAPGNKLLLTTYGDFVLPEARCLSKSVTKVVSNYILALPEKKFNTLENKRQEEEKQSPKP